MVAGVAVSLREVRPWTSSLDGSSREQALAIAEEVGRRVIDRPRSMTAAQAVSEANWAPSTIAHGDAGLSLFAGHLSTCLGDDECRDRAEDLIASALRSAGRADCIESGLFGGISGIAFAVSRLEQLPTRGSLIGVAQLARSVDRAAGWACEMVRTATPGPVQIFDLISGAAGVGVALLDRPDRGALIRILEAISSLADSRGTDVPWMTPAGATGDPAQTMRYPHGSFNCGLAHGIPGPMAIGAIAMREGIEVPGLAQALAAFSGWLVDHRTRDARGPDWPPMVAAMADGVSSVKADPQPTRTSWCYGSPGISRALWLTGSVLGDDALCEIAMQAITAALSRPRAERHLDSPTFCHGTAGLLQISLRFAHDTGRDEFRTAARSLAEELIAAFDPASRFGYRAPPSEYLPSERPGLLDGAAGIALALLAAASDVEPTWDRLFLLS